NNTVNHVSPQVDLRYRSVETVTVRVLLTGIHVADKVVYSSWTELRKINNKPISVDGNDVLYDFKKWCNKLDSLLPKHDHAMLFTRYNLTDFDDKGLLKDIL
ncbi:hypothetical protein MAR_001666, partial [Mya arenaria]